MDWNDEIHKVEGTLYFLELQFDAVARSYINQ